MSQENRSAVTKDDIVRGLRELGLEEGDVVLCHSSLSCFGYVEGGAETVVDALLEAVGPTGTVCMPTASWSGSQSVWLRNMAKLDVRHSPTCLGAINNALLRRPEAIRSLHPTHPCAAIGPQAGFLTRDHHHSPFSVGGPSPFMRNIELGGKLLFLGIDTRYNTTYHAMEELLTGYRLADETATGEVVDYDGSTIEVPVRIYAPGPGAGFTRHEQPLIERGVMKLGAIGDAQVRLLDGKGMYDYCVQCAQEDEFFLLSAPITEPEPLHVHPAADAKQRRMRGKLRELLGLGEDPPEISPVLCGIEEHEGVILQDWRLWHSYEPDEMIPLLIAIPEGIRTPAPAVICLHGSGRSREIVMAPELRHDPPTARLSGWGRALARRGFVTVALSQRTYGGRRGPDIFERAKVDLMYGKPLMGQLVADVLATVEFLAAGVPEADAGRIGCAGFSLGGIATFYSGCLEERIGLTMPVCGGVGSLAALAGHGDTSFHSTYYFIPHILQHFDHPQLLQTLCPRAFRMIGATQDRGMPLDAVEDLARIGRELYGEAGAADRFDVSIYPSEHDFTPQMLDRLTAWCQALL